MAGLSYTINFSDLEGLGRIEVALGDLTELMDDLGQVLVNSAKHRIGTTNEGPDGTTWQKSQRVIANGGVTLYDQGGLQRGINAHAGPDSVVVGTNTPYAAPMHYGAIVGALGTWTGTDKRGRKITVKSPWGNIPARPFLGVSADDALTLTEVATGYLGQVLEGRGA